MRRNIVLLGAMALFSMSLLSSCSHSKSTASNRVVDENSLRINKGASAANNYTIKIGEQRIKPYTINDKKKLKGLTLEQAQKKVLQEAVFASECAMIVEPNYIYEQKGRKIKSITVVGYPGYYNFEKDNVNK